MEYDSNNLNAIIMNLFTEDPIHVDNNICKIEPIESSSFTEQQKLTTTTTTVADSNHQQFLFIIFNNPKWSRILNKRSENVPIQSEQQGQQQQGQQQRLQPVTNRLVPTLVKHEKEDTSLDDQFIAQLRQLIHEYMQHTTRPLPLKYFLDLTDP
ncbi:unnamed protein product [Rotaria sp. Silwood2]|nr:unnamed protein product [Rotaria sp. Silwood2]